MVGRRGIPLLFCLVALASCQTPNERVVRYAGSGPVAGGSSGGTGGSDSAAPGLPTTVKLAHNTDAAARATMTAAKALLNRVPVFDTELNVGERSWSDYLRVVSTFLTDPAHSAKLKAALMEEHRAYLGLGGARAGSDIDFDGPARLGAYLVMNNVDYRDIVTAKYCVADTATGMQQVPCDTFRNQPGAVDEHGAGVLSSRAFIAMHKNTTGFNFRLVKEAFEKFACANYPDSNDPGTRAPDVSSAYAPFGLQNSRPSECYSCHRSMNPKALTFYNFGNDGLFTANTASTTRRDNNTPSVPGDMIVPGTTPYIFGRPVRNLSELGAEYARDSRFSKCMVRRFYNYLLGKPYTAPLPSEANYLVQNFERSGYKARDLFIWILADKNFVLQGRSQ